MKSVSSICVLALCAAGIGASGAQAVTVGLASYELGHVDGVYAYIDPLTFDGKAWFCISPDLEIYTGSHPYVYTVSSLTPANSASITEHTLTSAQIGEIGALANKGETDIKNRASGAAIAADASAIWAVEGSTVTADNAGTGASILADEAWAVGRSANVTIMTNVNGVQNVAGGVPEPTTWALMLIGFAGLGSTLRASRRRLRPVAA